MRSQKEKARNSPYGAPRVFLRALRIVKGYDQKKLARIARLKQPDISYFELGKRDPSPDEARRIARILHHSVQDLFPDLDNIEDGGVL